MHFPKILIFAWKLKIYHWQQILSNEATDSLFIWTAKHPCLNNQSFSVVLISKNTP